MYEKEILKASWVACLIKYSDEKEYIKNIPSNNLTGDIIQECYKENTPDGKKLVIPIYSVMKELGMKPFSVSTMGVLKKPFNNGIFIANIGIVCFTISSDSKYSQVGKFVGIDYGFTNTLFISNIMFDGKDFFLNN